MERIRVIPGSVVEQVYEDGTNVTAYVEHGDDDVTPSPVAIHEAYHIVAADNDLESSTIVPSGDAKGQTILKKTTSVAAAAPAAMNCDGISWDQHVVEDYLGEDFQTAMSAARQKLRGKGPLVYKVAAKLQREKIIGQTQVDNAVQELKDEQRGIREVVVYIGRPGEKTEKQTFQSFRNEIRISDLLG